MPEGDTIHHAAHRIRPVLEGRVPDELATPHPRFGARPLAREAGRPRGEAVDAHGKHLFLRFEGERVIHSHLRMTGSWGVYRDGQRWGRSPRRAWLVLRARGHEVVQFDGPVLELMTAVARALRPAHRRARPRHPRARLRRAARFLRRLRADDPTRPIGDALLDQRTIAGIGNLWKCEGCFDAGVDPWRPTGEVTDDEALRVVAPSRPRMQQSARDGFQARGHGDLRPRRPALPALRRRRSARAARATTTARPTGARDASTDASASATRAPTSSRRATRSRPSTRRSRRRGHGRVRRAARAPRPPGRARARPRLRGRARGAPFTLEEGLAHFAQDAVGGRRARRRPEDPGLRAARHRRAARVRPGRARAHLDDGAGEPASSARRRPRIRLGWSVPRVRRDYTPTRFTRCRRCWPLVRAPVLPGRAAGHPRGPRRRGHVALGARDPAPGAGGRARRAASSTCGPSTTPTRIAKLDALGVTGIITNDPRLFATA